MSPRPLRIAVIGSGISGLAVSHTLRDDARVTLFEAGDHFGGHTNTVDICLPTPQGLKVHGVDTGFLVFNDLTYPNLVNLFSELGVDTAASDMSFSVQAPMPGQARRIEWSGSSLNSVFAQRGNLLNPAFLRMLRDLLRFNAISTRLAMRGHPEDFAKPLAQFLEEHQLGSDFQHLYLLPMLGCIWSCPAGQMLRFPTATMIRFCHNHGLLRLHNRPQWRTVRGGARNYVRRMLEGIADKRLNMPAVRIDRDADGVRVWTQAGGNTLAERFDKVVLATHSDQALQLLHEPSAAERATLGGIRYQPNRAVLHTDSGMLPQSRRAWASWNYEHGGISEDGADNVCLHYLINRLQPLPFRQPVLVSLNPRREIVRRHVLAEFEYAHPVFDAAAMRAQSDVPSLQGRRHTYFCGAWMGYGFHEDGLKAGLSVARALLLEARAACLPREHIA